MVSQRMLGENARVQTKAAAAADTDLLIDGVILATEGECPSCDASAPISQGEKGEAIVDCASMDNSRGVAGEDCVGCDEKYPARYTCPDCGINSPVVDFIPDRGMVMFSKFRADFPTLNGENPLGYLDNACMTLRPNSVIEAIRSCAKISGCGGRSVHRYATTVSRK